MVVIAPATANVIAKLAHGLADDLLYDRAAGDARAAAPRAGDERAHVGARGDAGEPADAGGARSARWSVRGAARWRAATRARDVWRSPARSSRRSPASLAPKDLRGERVLVSAGPTREAIDPGALPLEPLEREDGLRDRARRAPPRRRGGAGDGADGLPPPPGVRTVAVTTADEMQRALDAEFRAASVLVMAAAVADYRPRAPAARKLKKGARPLRRWSSSARRTSWPVWRRRRAAGS